MYVFVIQFRFLKFFPFPKHAVFFFSTKAAKVFIKPRWIFGFAHHIFLRNALLHNLHQIRMKSIPGTIDVITFINTIFSEQSFFRNALWLPDLVRRFPDWLVTNCWGQRSRRGHPGSTSTRDSNSLEIPYGHQIS